MNYRIARRIRARTALPLEYDYETRRLTRIPRDIRLRDGELRLQELRPVNREQLKTFFSRCSPQAIYDRFLSGNSPADSMLDYLTDCDGSRHVGLVVTQQEGNEELIIAEGRYVILAEQPAIAEIALLVADQMRRRGIATLLIRELIEIACRNGVTHFSAEVSADNGPTISLLRKVSHSLSSSIWGREIHFEFPILMRKRTAGEKAERDGVRLCAHAKRILENLGIMNNSNLNVSSVLESNNNGLGGRVVRLKHGGW